MADDYNSRGIGSDDSSGARISTHTLLTMHFVFVQRVPEAICALKHLVALNLAHNELAAYPSAACLPSLIKLDLSHNRCGPWDMPHCSAIWSS